MVQVAGRAGAQRVGRYRRLVASAVFAASTIALLATSYAPVQSILVATHQGSVDLTPDAPRATGRLRLDLSAEALPEQDPPRRSVGEVRFSTAETDGRVMAVTAVGHDALPTPEFGGLTFPIGQVCRVAEPCEVEFEVVLELTAPHRELRAVSFVAELEITYEEVENNPDGASASWTETSELASGPEGPTETAATDPERITLDEGAFAVSRHVVVGASEAARKGITDVIVSTDAGRDVGRVLVTIQLDRPGPAAVGEGEPIDPFADCPSNDRCERGLTVTFQLIGEPQDTAATFEWQAEVRAAFPGAEAIPAEAMVDAVVDAMSGVTQATPRLVGRVDGSVVLDEPGNPASGRDSTTVAVRIDVSAGGLPARGFSGMPVTSLARLSLTSDHAGTIHLEVRGNDVSEDVGTVKYGPQQPGALIFNPIRSCPLERACSREVILTITPRGVDGAAEITWTLDLAIAYPGLNDVPLAARVDLLVDPARR